MEEWRDIPGFQHYQASSLGRIRSIKHADSLGRIVGGRVIAQQRMCHGYMAANVKRTDATRHSPECVHRLVCMAFHGIPPFEGAVAAHLDGSRDMNVPNNVVWSSQSENIAAKHDHGTQTRGENHGLSKLSDDDVRAIKARLAEGVRQREIADHYGVTQSNISCIARGKSWAHLE